MSSNRAVATSSCGPTDPTVGSLTRQSDSDKQEEGGGDTEDPATNAANDPPRRTSAIISQMVAETLLSLRSPTQSPTHERDLFAASVLEQLGSSDYEDEDDEEPSDGRVFTGAEDLDAHLEILFETVQRGAGATGGHVDSLSLVAAAMELDAKWIGAGSLMHHAGSGGFKRNGYTFGVSQDALLLKQENDTHFPDAAGRDDVESLDWSEVVKYVEGDESETESYVQPTSRTRTPSNGSRKRKYDMRLERPFVCVIDTCRKSYTKKRGLIIHGKMAHPDPASLERLKKVLPKPAAQSKALSGVIYDEEDEDDFGEKEDDESDTDSFMMRGKRSRSHEPGSVKGSPISRASSLPKSSTLLKGSSLSLKGAPSINVSTPDGTTDVNQSPSMTKKKRIRRLSASDFTSDSGGEGMLSAQMAEDLAARINHLNEQRPFLCTHKGCTKRYKNSNGLKYHLEKHHAFIYFDSVNSSAQSSTASLIGNTEALQLVSAHGSTQSLAKLAPGKLTVETKLGGRKTSPFAHTNEEEDADASVRSGSDNAARDETPSPILDPVGLVTDVRPFMCPYQSCGKAYKNKNGLLYHLRKGKMTFHAKLDEKSE